MRKKNAISALLHADAKTAANITEMYPADWCMDAVFRRSYRKFRRQAAETNAVPKPYISNPPQDAAQRTMRMIHANKWLTAACLMLTVGIAGGTAWMLLSAPQPPATLQTSSTAEDAFIEETQPAQTAAEDTSDAAPQHAETTAVHTGSAVQTQTTDSTPSESQSALPVRTDVPQYTETAAASTRTEPTASKQTGTTAPPYTGTTKPVQTTAASVPAPPIEETDIIPNDAPEPPPSMGDNNQQNHAERLTVVDDPAISEAEFYIWYEFEDQTVYPNPDFTVALEGYSVTITNPGGYAVSNMIVNEETGVRVSADFVTGARTQLLRFHSVYTYQDVTVHAQEGRTLAYLLMGERQCELIWFDGRYLCTLRTDSAHTNELYRIAEAMITH